MQFRELPLASTLLLALPAFVACQSGLGQGPLDGRVYQVTLAGPKDATPDNLVFDGGRFESTACRNYGFTTTPYSAKADGAASTFEASAKSGQASTTAWNGKIQGDGIQGTMVLTDGQGAKSEFRFVGTALTGPLDGQVFDGMICEGDASTGDKDRLVFRSGCLDSQACRPYGFTMAPYTTTPEGDGIRFRAEAINCDGDKNCWDGVVRGGELAGTLEHKDASGKTTDKYRFVAKLAK
jgi:hypothetical protein